MPRHIFGRGPNRNSHFPPFIHHDYNSPFIESSAWRELNTISGARQDVSINTEPVLTFGKARGSRPIKTTARSLAMRRGHLWAATDVRCTIGWERMHEMLLLRMGS